MSGPFKRRPSLKTLPVGGLQRPSLSSMSHRRKSSVGIPSSTTVQNREIPWDVLDRCLLPLVFCHAAASVVSGAVNSFGFSDIDTFTLFIVFSILTVCTILFYHNLMVTAAGKAVFITGADSRIGSALVRYLDEQGFAVFAGFQNIANPHAAELKEACSARLHCLQVDVTVESQILAANLFICEHIPETAPGLWAVIHCASWVALGEIEWVPPQVVKKATEVNLIGATRVNQVMLPLVRRARGRIVYVTSGMTRVPSPVRGIHCALLAALETQAACLREELKNRHVDVVVVAPGEFTVGNNWLTDENIRQQAKDMWTHLGVEQKSEYGEDYFENAIRGLERYTKYSDDVDLTAVLRALANAVTRTFPLPKYTPVSRKEKLQIFIAEHFPRSVYDVIYS